MIKIATLPICLSILLPHNSIELIIVLIAENESNVIVIYLCINEECSLKVNSSKPVEPDR